MGFSAVAADGVDGLDVTENVITNATRGVRLIDLGLGLNSSDVNVSGNLIQDHSVLNVAVDANTLAPGEVVTADNNWWGTADFNAIEAKNSATGVLVNTYLASDADADDDTPGFQPNTDVVTVVRGDAAGNTLNGTAAKEWFMAGAGDDTVNYTVGGGIDGVDGGADNDVLNVNGTASAETFALTRNAAGNALLIDTGGSADAEITVRRVEDIVINTIDGGDDVTVIGDLTGTGVATSTITLNGDAGENTFDAGSVTSAHGFVMSGGGGNDIFVGGVGGDTLTGGGGKDEFRFYVGFGLDTVTDFDGSGSEILRFGSAVFASVGGALAARSQSGPDVVITKDANNKVTLEGVTLANVTAKNIDILGQNDPPTLAAMSGAVDTVAEDTQIEIAFGDITAQGDEADVDSTVDAFIVKTVSGGVLKIGTSAGTATDFAGGTNDTIDATRKAYWTGAQDVNGTVNAFTVVAKDAGGLESATPVQVQVSITAVNDAPVVDLDRNAGGSGVTRSYTENAGDMPIRIAPDVQLLDVDSANFDGGTLTVGITPATVSGSDRINIQNQGDGAGQIGINGSDVNFENVKIGTFTGGSNTGNDLVVTFNASASIAAVEALLGRIRYHNTSENPSTTQRQVTFTLVDGDGQADGGADTSITTAAINVTAVNDAPVLSNLGPSVASTEQVFAKLDVDANVSDVDLSARNSGNGNYGGSSLTISRNGGTNFDDAFAFDTAGALFSVFGNNLEFATDHFANFVLSNGTFTINFENGGPTATTALVNDVVRHITYRNLSDTPPASPVLTYTFNDGSPGGGQGTGASATTTADITVNIAAINDTPVNMVPGAQTVDEDTNLVFDFTHTNEIGVFDPDAAAGNVRMTLHVDNGALNVRTDVAGGLGASQVTGDNTGTVVLTATQDQLNMTLMADNGLVYKGDSNFSGNDTLTVTTNDLGKTGSDPGLTGDGTSEADIDTVTITVNPVDDAALPKAVLTILHTSGTFERLNFDGLTYAAAHDINPGAGWNLVSTRGDFNGDGQPDVVLRHGASGTVELMLMSELDYIAIDDSAWGTDWQVVSTRGDYNNDGKSDIVLHNATTGTLEVMLMNGLDYSAVRDIEVGTGWVLADGRGDYDGNGKADLLLRHAATGTLEIMLMDGADYTAVRDFTPGADWTVASGHDNLNGGNLKSDIILRHTPSGTLQLMLMDGTDYTATRNMTFSSDWQMASTGNDLNGDGKADLVMRHGPTGIAGLYLMDGLDYTAVLNKAYSTSLQIIDTAPDLNADGKTDLVLGNATTGLVELSLMNGLAFTATQDYNFGAGWQVIA